MYIKLQILKERKEKADRLPIETREEWKNEYDKLIKEIIEVERQYEKFNPKLAEKVIFEAVQKANEKTSFFTEADVNYLQTHTRLWVELLESMDSIDRLYVKASSNTEVEMATKTYLKIIDRMIKAVLDLR